MFLKSRPRPRARALGGDLPYPVTWNAHSQAETYKLFYSLDGGPFVWAANLGNVTEYSWSPPNVAIPTSAQLRVNAFDGSGVKVGTADSELFTIEPTPFAVTAPTATDTLAGNNPASVSWISHVQAESYNVFYSLDGGAFVWAANLDNVTGFTWMPPNVATPTSARVRVNAFDGSGVKIDTVTSESFTIEPGLPPFIVTAPVSSDTLAGNIAATVTWNAHFSAESYKLFYSLDGGPFVWLANLGNVTEYTWMPPNVGAPTSAQLKVNAFNGSGTRVSVVKSDVFTIEPGLPPFAVTAPIASDTLTGNTQTTVTWDIHSLAESYKLFYSLNGGPFIWLANLDNVSEYDWMLPNVGASTSARLKINAIDGGGTRVGVVTSDVFTIEP